MRLAPGKRTSWPHAQSKEEEFALVLKGQPRVWLNGIAHSLLGGDAESELLVWGQTDQACPNDKIYYPFHESRNNECREKNRLWNDFKMMEPIGPHDGRP